MKTLVLNPRNENKISFVLTEEGRVIAVIVPKPNEDNLGLIAQAILDEYPEVTQVRFEKIESNDDEFISEVKLEVLLHDEDEEESIREFELTKTALYND